MPPRKLAPRSKPATGHGGLSKPLVEESPQSTRPRTRRQTALEDLNWVGRTRSQTKAARQTTSFVEKKGPPAASFAVNETRRRQPARPKATRTRSPPPVPPQQRSTNKQPRKSVAKARNTASRNNPPAAHPSTSQSSLQHPSIEKSGKGRRFNPQLAPDVVPWLGSQHSPRSLDSHQERSEALQEPDIQDDWSVPSPRSNSHSVVLMSAPPQSSNRSKVTEYVNGSEYEHRLAEVNADPEEPTEDSWEPICGMRDRLNAAKDLPLQQESIDSIIRMTKTFLAEFESGEGESERGNRDLMLLLDKFRKEFLDMLPTSQILTITKERFANDIALSKKSNEHVFQRTVMMSAIDHWNLAPLFTFNCEQVWTKSSLNRLTTTGAPLFSNKPDLAISFNPLAIREGLKKGKRVKKEADLSFCYSPDGDQKRWFPFFFIEAKKSDGDFEQAKSRNMHHASQALHNICRCMQKAGDIHRFDMVRTFSIAITPKELEVRVHRAVPDNDAAYPWEYLFDVFYEKTAYTRDNLAVLIRSILFEYAAKILRPLLQDTHYELARQNELNQISSKSRHNFDKIITDFLKSYNDNITDTESAESDDDQDAMLGSQDILASQGEASASYNNLPAFTGQGRKRAGAEMTGRSSNNKAARN